MSGRMKEKKNDTESNKWSNMHNQQNAWATNFHNIKLNVLSKQISILEEEKKFSKKVCKKKSVKHTIIIMHKPKCLYF